MRDRLIIVLAVAAGWNLLWAGAITFRVLVDLPARSTIGAVAFADLSRATDLSRGLVFYPVGAIGSALMSSAAWLVARWARASTRVKWLTAVAAISSALVLLVTAKAAPLMLRIGSAPNDPRVLGALADGFTAWTNVRAMFADLAAVALLVALTAAALTRQTRREKVDARA